MNGIRPILIKRTTDGEDNDDPVVAHGVALPSGTVVIEWDRMAFPEDQRTDGRTRSIYRDVADCKTATGGEVIVGTAEFLPAEDGQETPYGRTD